MLVREDEVEVVDNAFLVCLGEGGVVSTRRALRLDEHGTAAVATRGCDQELAALWVSGEGHQVDEPQGAAPATIQAHLHTEVACVRIHGAVWQLLWDATAVKLHKVLVAVLDPC